MSKNIKKFVLMTFVFVSLCVLGSIDAFAFCSSSETPENEGAKQLKYPVVNFTGYRVGHVLELTDGTWSLWLDGQGASNQVYMKKQDAVEALCEKPQTLK
jgi:hypothetical protein